MKIVQLPPREVLLTLDYFYLLAARLIMRIDGRRSAPEWAADVLFRAIEEEWIILTGEGEPLEIDDDLIERTHGNDPSRRCVSDIVKCATKPRRRRPRATLLGRLQVYDSALKLAGLPVMPADRKAEVAAMRELLRSLSAVRRAYLVKAYRDLRRKAGDKPDPIEFSYEIRRLRVRLYQEQLHWLANR